MGNKPSAAVAAPANEAPAAQFAAAAAATAAATTPECPVSEETRQAWAGRWGGSKKAAPDAGLDPKNNMPAVPLQGAAPGQATSLDTTRVKSTIPKGDAAGGSLEATWEYPSPQMFWNAMVRKNKTGGASEDDMSVVVAIHNNMNETTWAAVLAWEALATGGGADSSPPPKLLRFTGRPHDTSPKAMLKQALLGCPLPFDRHDWVVLRADGEEVR
jgi:cytochrome c heme-lyase